VGPKRKLKSESTGCHQNLKIKIYKSTILPVVSYRCETLRVFENRMLRRKFGPKREEVAELTNLMEQSPSRQAVTQLVKKISAFYGTRRFINMFTRACH